MASEIRAPEVTVGLARASDLPLIEGLFQLYIYDFSEMEPPGSSNFELDEHGRFAPYPGLDNYWERDGFHPLLIRVDGRPAGFALVNTRSHRGGAVEHNMGEFFVARKHRRAGVATEAVRRVLGLYPGRWEIAVVERNVAARSFWPRAIAAAPGISGLERLEGDGEQWRGPIWRFDAADPAK